MPRNGVRLVADTNIIVSGLLWQGAPSLLMRAAHQGRIYLVSSRPLLDEFEDVVRRRKFVKKRAELDLTPGEMLDAVHRAVELVEPATIQPICRDPDDDLILATALAGDADLIVTGDDDLLALGRYGGIDIVTVAEALSRLPTSQPR